MMPSEREPPVAHSGSHTRVLCSLACLLAALVSAAPAQAQTFSLGHLVLAQPQLSAADVDARNTAMARALFDEGLRYVDTEQWQQAQDRFARVLTLRYSAVAAYNWGLAQARLGKGVVASTTLRRILSDNGLDATVRERATALLGDVESRFAWLNVRVLGDCNGCSVTLNEAEWPWAVVGVFVPVDAGHYALRLRVGNSIVSEERLEIAPTARLEATLAPTSEALTAARKSRSDALDTKQPSGPGEAAQQSASARGSILGSGWFWGAMGVLAAGAAAAIILETR
jgi:hypothetical protein